MIGLVILSILVLTGYSWLILLATDNHQCLNDAITISFKPNLIKYKKYKKKHRPCTSTCEDFLASAIAISGVRCYTVLSDLSRNILNCNCSPYSTLVIMYLPNKMCVQEFSEHRFFAFISLCADLSHNDHQNLIYLYTA